MVISPQLGHSNFVALVPRGIVRLQLVQIGVCIIAVVLVAVLMVTFSFFECTVYNERLLIFAMLAKVKEPRRKN